jgi:hypothetical protein
MIPVEIHCAEALEAAQSLVYFFVRISFVGTVALGYLLWTWLTCVVCHNL